MCSHISYHDPGIVINKPLLYPLLTYTESQVMDLIIEPDIALISKVNTIGLMKGHLVSLLKNL